MLHRPVGKLNVDASVVALGCWAIGGWMWGGNDENQAIKTIHAAIDSGINFLDTAAVYGFGRSEEIVGKALRGKRDKVILATKCGLVWDRTDGDFHFYSDDKHPVKGPAKYAIYKCLKPDSIISEVERSLKRLQTDYIDLYQTHRQDSTTPVDETKETLEKLKKQGKIRAIGVSNVTLDHLKAYGDIDSDQESYSMLDRQIEQNGIRDYCREHNIAILAYSPMARGLLTGKLTEDRVFNEGDQRKDNPLFSVERRKKINAMLAEFTNIARAHNATTTQIVIAWTFNQPGITHVLCGARTPQQAIENAQAGSIKLTPAEIASVNDIVNRHTNEFE